MITTKVIEHEEIYFEISELNLKYAKLMQELKILNNQRSINFSTKRSNIKKERLEILFFEVKAKSAVDYKGVMAILNLNHRQTAYNLMRQCEEAYPAEIVLVRSISRKKLLLVWREDIE